MNKRLFAVGRNINGEETSVGIWPEGTNKGDYCGPFVEFRFNPVSGVHPFTPRVGEHFSGVYTLKQVRELVPHLAP